MAGFALGAGAGATAYLYAAFWALALPLAALGFSRIDPHAWPSCPPRAEHVFARGVPPRATFKENPMISLNLRHVLRMTTASTACSPRCWRPPVACRRNASGRHGAPAGRRALPAVAVGPQYDTTHVCVAPEDFDRFTDSFVATFGGKKSKQGVFQVTPTPSQTMSQLVLTPVGTLSVFGFKTPIPYPFCESAPAIW